MIISTSINRSIKKLSENKVKSANKHKCNKIPVLTSLPDFNVDVDKKRYPWHLKISIASKLDFSDTENITNEFMTQFNIENKILHLLENTCEVKKVCSYQQKGKNIHHWYISNCKTNLSIDNIVELDIINKQRAIDFELKEDKKWEAVAPILNKVKANAPKFNSITKNTYDNIYDM